MHLNWFDFTRWAQDDKTPLHYAVDGGHVAVVAAIVAAAGADMNVKDRVRPLTRPGVSESL